MRKNSRRWQWLAFGALSILLLAVNEVAGAGGYLQRRQQEQRINALSEELGKLKTENQELTDRVHNLRSNPAAIEQYAREQLHLARPGELVVTLPEAGSAKPPAPSPQ